MDALAKGEQELRYWLANEDWYMSRYTRDWLDRTPRDRAVDVLAGIAEGADREPRSVFAAGLLLMAWFSISGSVSSGPNVRKAGTRAALMLAKLDDSRAIPALARVYSASGRRQGKYHELVEAGLAGILSRKAGDAEIVGYRGIVQERAEGVWKTFDRRRDLSAGAADLLIACFRVLAAPGMEADCGVLRAAAAEWGESNRPQLGRAADAARALGGDSR